MSIKGISLRPPADTLALFWVREGRKLVGLFSKSYPLGFRKSKDVFLLTLGNGRYLCNKIFKRQKKKRNSLQWEIF